MKIVHITAGAGGRICGSCLHDNALVRALRARGRDAMLVPAYVPTTTDEENVAERRIVLGGVNVWLQQHLAVFRHTPWFVDRLFDERSLLEWLSRRTGSTRPADLGALTESTLLGERGRQRKEVEKLARWLADEVRPDVVHLSNLLLAGLAERIRETSGAKIVCTLSGEDLFIGQLAEPHQSRVKSLIAGRGRSIDRFIALNHFYADFMAAGFGIPRARISVVPHGVDPSGFPDSPPDLAARRMNRGGRTVVGFLARACPEKGLHLLVEALGLLVEEGCDVEVFAAGATVDAERSYVEDCLSRAAALGVSDRFRWLGQVDRAGKQALLGSIDLFALPATHPEAKGIPVLEAFAAGVPVVAADAGGFPEYITPRGGAAAGWLHRPGDAADLARTIGRAIDAPDEAAGRGRAGHAASRSLFTPESMAEGHEAVYRLVAEAPARDAAHEVEE